MSDPHTTVNRAETRLMELTDVPFAVDLHRTVLPRGFFVDLGPRFLSAYYRSYLTSPAAIGLVAVIDGQRAGYLVGTIDRDAHYRHVVRSDRWRLAILGAMSLIVRPHLAVRFARTRLTRYVRGVRRFAREPQIVVTTHGQCHGVLSHVAVTPTHRRMAAGRTLTEAFADVARSSGSICADVLTRADNVAARTMYETLGWSLNTEQTDVDGHEWATYRYELRR